ncbi:MAG: T9SS type A sorting domain-containing protein [Bacteroidia bacterium]|nr:T9SS type A sorting domain-containing protein [Bacteroidia bacterium]
MKYKTVKSLLSLCAILLLGFSFGIAKENIGIVKKKNGGMRASAACAPASSSVELDVNNIRCLLHNGGDMWWDLVSNPRYEVPKVDVAADKRYSSFAGSLWIGGVDGGGQLRVAAQTYRQSGNDFWPGPLAAGGATIDDVTCEKWDKHYRITKAEIDAFRAEFLANGSADMSNYPNVEKWPTEGTDSEGNTVNLAPFFDLNGNLRYEPEYGEYPNITPCEGGGTPDLAVWWVINDKGDVHTETGGEAIGLEIQMMAFAFSTSNEVNNMTFYKYTVINKSTLSLNQTYMGQWVDADVGFYSDDYVGCDTNRGLGFAFNGLTNDAGPTGYGLNPPALGVDFFQGPKADPYDGIDNNHNGIIDEDGELIGMSKFVYYENDFSLRGNPEVATHYYGYLRGFWKDGSEMVNNGKNGYPGTAAGPVTDYMYPGDGGWCGGTGSGWSEVSAGNQPFDRRFLESAGPFTLQPGAVNAIVTGAVWARGYYNDNKGSVCELRKADDVAQALFDACFQLLDGPDAPELTVTELDKELLLSWDYSPQACQVRNNCNESYEQSDPVLVSQGLPDPTFEFEGYILYQLKNNSVSASELTDSEKARMIAQCDIKNDIATIVNRTSETVGGYNGSIVVDEIMVQGANEGIFKSIRITEDFFATGSDRSLKNYTTYYYGIIAYAYNDTASDGRKFVQGNRFFANTAAVPHKIDFENGGTVINSAYGDGISVTQTAGYGNGNRFVVISDDTESEILSMNSASDITYVAGQGPVVIKVIDPKQVQDMDYRLELVEDQFSGEAPDTVENTGTPVIDSVFYDWILYDGSSGNNVIFANSYTKRTKGSSVSYRPEPFNGKEKPIEGHGISIVVKNGVDAGDTLQEGFIGSSVTYGDEILDWLTGVTDDDDFKTWDWIRSGKAATDNSKPWHKANKLYDGPENFEAIEGGTWAPFCLGRGYNGNSGQIGPGFEIAPTALGTNIAPDQVINLTNMPDVDIVFTSDTTLWSQCVVVETSPTQGLGSGAWPMTARWELPVDMQGKPTASSLSMSNQGMSWFPGYAININTGQRLNIFFGESSWDKLNNGDDMLWNPTSDRGSSLERVGGRHYVWVHNSLYDGCAVIRNGLAVGTTAANAVNAHTFNVPGKGNVSIADIYKDVAWVGLPMLNAGYSFSHPRYLPTDARIKLRVSKVFGSRKGTTDHPVFGFSTSDIAAQLGQTDVAEQSVLEQIRVVPNPYYAFSKYESSQLQTTVKITNLPQKCTIRIFTLNGTLIRTYTKESSKPNQDWDLKNASGVPVASGVYIIHIDAGDLGEKILKFFAIMPQLDLNAF